MSPFRLLQPSRLFEACNQQGAENAPRWSVGPRWLGDITIFVVPSINGKHWRAREPREARPLPANGVWHQRSNCLQCHSDNARYSFQHLVKRQTNMLYEVSHGRVICLKKKAAVLTSACINTHSTKIKKKTPLILLPFFMSWSNKVRLLCTQKINFP